MSAFQEDLQLAREKGEIGEKPQHEGLAVDLAAKEGGAAFGASAAPLWSHLYIINPGENAQGEATCSAETCARSREVLGDFARAGGFTIESAALSMIRPGCKIRVHVAPHNARVKLHLGLVVPTDTTTGEGLAYIEVGRVRRRWQLGRVLAFDDSFEHFVKFPRGDGGDDVGVRAVLEVTLHQGTQRELMLEKEEFERECASE